MREQMELSVCKALLLTALIVSSSRLLHWPIGCSAGSSAGSPGQLALPPQGAGDDGQGKQPGRQDQELPFLGRGVRACFPAGAVGRFHQAMLLVLLARGGCRMTIGRWRSSRGRV